MAVGASVAFASPLARLPLREALTNSSGVCRLEVQPWDLAVVQLRGRNGGERLALLEAAAVGGSEAPLAVAVCQGPEGGCVVLPQDIAKALCTNGLDANGCVDVPWLAVQLPPAAPPGALPSLCAALSAAGIQALAVAAAQPRTVVLLKAKDVALAAVTLMAAGFAVGPSARFCSAPLTASADCGAGRAGVWSHAEPGESCDNGRELPYALRFESGTGIYLDIRIPTSSKGPWAVEATCAGLCSEEPRRGLVRRPVIAMQPPSPGEWRAEDLSGWARLAEGNTLTLELAAGGGQMGFWLFSGPFFARITGAPFGQGLVGGFCCRDTAQLKSVCGDAVTSELRSQYEAVLGRVERQGLLRILRRSWAPLAPGTLLYDSSSGEGGSIEVDSDGGVVVHKLAGGGEQRWRIMHMIEDPFGPPPSEDAASEAAESDTASSGAVRQKGKKRKDAGVSRSPSIVVFDGRSQSSSSSSRSGKRRREKEKGKERKHRDASTDSDRRKKDKGKDRKDKEKEKEKEKRRDKEREREEEKEKDKEKERDRDKDREKRKDRERDKEKERERSLSKDRNRKRRDERSRSRSHSKSASRSRKDKKRKDDRLRSRDRSRSRDRLRSRDRRRDRERAPRSRSKRREKDRDRPRARSPSRSQTSVSRSKSRRQQRANGFDSRAPSIAVAPLTIPGGAFATASVLGQLTSAAATTTLSVPGTMPSVGMPALATPGYPADPEVEAFLAMNPVDPPAASRFRALAPQMQRQVLTRGSLLGARDASAVLNSRIRDAMQGGGAPAAAAVGGHPGIDAMIQRYVLDAQCAQMLKALPQHLQEQACNLPVHEARNPSAFVMAQLQSPTGRFRQGAPPPPPPPFSALTLQQSMFTVV